MFGEREDDPCGNDTVRTSGRVRTDADVARAPPLVPNPAPPARPPYPLVPHALTLCFSTPTRRLRHRRSRLSPLLPTLHCGLLLLPLSSMPWLPSPPNHALLQTAVAIMDGLPQGGPMELRTSPVVDLWGRHRSSGAGGLLHRGASSSTSTAACSPMVDAWGPRRSGCSVTVVHPGAPPPPQRRHEGASPVVDACSSGPPWWIHGGRCRSGGVPPLHSLCFSSFFCCFILFERYVSVELFGC
jgi:hypothetical protein